MKMRFQLTQRKIPPPLGTSRILSPPARASALNNVICYAKMYRHLQPPWSVPTIPIWGIRCVSNTGHTSSTPYMHCGTKQSLKRRTGMNSNNKDKEKYNHQWNNQTCSSIIGPTVMYNIFFISSCATFHHSEWYIFQESAPSIEYMISPTTPMLFALTTSPPWAIVYCV